MPPLFLYLVFLAVMKLAGRFIKGRGTAPRIETSPLANLLSLLKLTAIAFGFIITACLTFFMQYYLIFTPGRKAGLESSMGVIFTDDVKPVRYKYIGAPDGGVRRLWLTTDKSGEHFVSENIAGEITGYTMDGMVYFPGDDEYAPVPVADFAGEYGFPDGLEEYYTYRYNGRLFKVLIYAENDGCKIEIIR